MAIRKFNSELMNKKKANTRKLEDLKREILY